jgi:hypothetical protein
VIKFASPVDWVRLNDIWAPVEIKISSRGFLPGDYRKIASEVGDRFIHHVRQIEDQLDQKNCKYAHVISCGNTEKFGVNRNGDAWAAADLNKDMHTYLKHGKCFRDHRNGKDDLFYGRPKVAFHDDQRGYGRLLCEYFANEKAASEKNARVADLEIEALARDGEIKVSHGTRIGTDSCSICGNRAKTRRDYCESKEAGGKCRLFGCKSGLSKLSDEGELQFVHNDDGNIFYDISSIGLSKYGSARQADRIAYATPFDLAMDKVASTLDYNPGSAFIAEQMNMDPRHDLLFEASSLSAYQIKLCHLATRLAKCDDYEIVDRPSDVPGELSKLGSEHPTIASGAAAYLVSTKQLPGPATFAKAIGADVIDAQKVAELQDGIYSRLVEHQTITDLVKTSVFCQKPLTDCGISISSSALRPVSQQQIRRDKQAAVLLDLPAVKLSSHYTQKQAAIAAQYAALKLAVLSQILD